MRTASIGPWVFQTLSIFTVFVDTQCRYDVFCSTQRAAVLVSSYFFLKKDESTALPLCDARLPEDQLPPCALSDWERLTLSSEPDLSRAQRILSKRFSRFSLENFYAEEHLVDIEQCEQFYGGEPFRSNPLSFFVDPPCAPRVVKSEPHTLSEGEVFDLCFVSPYSVINPAYEEEYQRYSGNNVCYARAWMHPPGKAHATVIGIHGWFMGDQRVNAIALVPGFFYRLGLNVILYEMPFHGRRAPADVSSTISLFPSINVMRTNEAVAQSIAELRSLRRWCLEQADIPIGVMGMSLGGYLAALWASLDALDFCIPMVPLVSMGALAWEVVTEVDANVDVLMEALAVKLTPERLDALFALHCPLNYTPRLESDRMMIVAGLGDRIVGPQQPRTLWEHWGRPRMHWFSGGHLEHINQIHVFNELQHFLFGLGLADRRLLPIVDEPETIPG